MCWMTVRTGADALTGVLDDLEPQEELNGHSWGVAYVRDGELVVEKGVGEVPRWEFADLERDGSVTAAMAHTRFATRGLVCTANAHPFPITDDDGEIVAALAHNGTWREAPDDDFHADSYWMARDLEQRYRADPDAPFADHVQATGDRTGETFIALRNDGVGFVYSGRYTITRGEEPAFAERQSEPEPDVDPYDAPSLREALERRFAPWRSADEPATDGGKPTTTVARSSGGKPITTGTVVRVDAA